MAGSHDIRDKALCSNGRFGDVFGGTRTGRESLKRLISQFTPSQVSKQHLEAAKKKIREIDPENIERISRGAYVLFGWATSILMQLDKSFELHKENKFDVIKRALQVEHALVNSSNHQD